MVYAVIASGGKQYRVVPGQTLKLELLEKEAGKTFNFEEVLLVANGDAIKIGSPFLKDAKVSAEVVGTGRADKVHIMKFRRRKHHMKQAGHRQHFIEVKITSIDGVAAEAKVKTATAKTTKAKKTVKAKTTAKKTAATAKMSEA